jgi:biopolymer transport protein ExbD
MASNPGFTQLCPSCKVPLLLRDPAWIGKMVECPKCHTRFVVEDPAKKAAPAAPPVVQQTPPAMKPPPAAPAARAAPPPPQPTAPRAPDKEVLIRQDKEAVRRQEQLRKEALIRKDREAVRGKTAPDDGSGSKPAGITTRPSAPAKSAPTGDKSKLAMERLFAGGVLLEGKGTRRAPRRRAHGDEAGVNLSVFITPMLDMAFQLLAFFIVTYHPSALERHIDGTLLPPANIAIKGTAKKEDTTPVDTPPDDKDTVVVQVKAVKRGQVEGKHHEGELSQIYLKTKEDANPELIVDSDQDLDSGLKRLRDRLKGLQEKGAKAKINIAADSDLKHEFFIRVYDVCKASKFEDVGFIAPVDAEPKKGG